MTKHVFLSFVEEDLYRVNLFRGQAKNKRSDLVFDDYSVKIPYKSSDADYIKSKITERIRATSVTICLIGAYTYTSDWVSWEVDKSVSLGNKVLGVRLYSDRTHNVSSALTTRDARVLPWDIDRIVREIG